LLFSWAAATTSSPTASPKNSTTATAAPKNSGSSPSPTTIPSTSTPPDPSGIASYKVYREDTSSGNISTFSSINTAYTDYSAVIGRNYDYWATAIDGAGLESGPSNVENVTVDPPSMGGGPPAPVITNIQPSDSFNEGSFSWDMEASYTGTILYYNVYAFGSLVPTTTTTGNIYVSGSNCNEVTFEVTAVDVAGAESSRSQAIIPGGGSGC